MSFSKCSCSQIGRTTQHFIPLLSRSLEDDHLYVTEKILPTYSSDIYCSEHFFTGHRFTFFRSDETLAKHSVIFNSINADERIGRGEGAIYVGKP